MGTGNVTNITQAGGGVYPGDPDTVGTITISSISQTSGSINIKVNGVTRGSYDTVLVGSAVLQGIINVTFLGAFSFDNGDILNGVILETQKGKITGIVR